MTLRASGGMSVSQASGMFAPKPISQTATPLTGDTVVMTADPALTALWLTPATNLATLNLTTPAGASSAAGQQITISSSKNITLLTFTGLNVLGAPTSLLANQAFQIVKQATPANTWIYIGLA